VVTFEPLQVEEERRALQALRGDFDRAAAGSAEALHVAQA
jgi:hypothetical protein